MELFFGYGTIIASLLVVSFGLPAQIYKNWKNKRSAMSIFLLIGTLLVYLFRIPYTIIRKDWFILIPDSLGFCFSVILIIQYFTYRKNTT